MGLLQCGLISEDHRIQGIRIGLHLIVLIFGHVPFRDQSAIPFRLHSGVLGLDLIFLQDSLGVFQVRLVADPVGLGLSDLGKVFFEDGLCLIQGRLKGARVHYEEEISLFHMLSLFEGGLCHLSVDHGLYGNRGIRLDVSNGSDLNRDVLAGDGRDGDRRGRLLFLIPLCLWRAGKTK